MKSPPISIGGWWIANPQMIGSIEAQIDRTVPAAAQEALRAGQSQRHPIAAAESSEVFLDVIAPSPEIIAGGGVPSSWH